MNTKGEIGGLAILTLFITLLIGLTFLPAIANTQNLITQKQTIRNESVNIGTSRNSTGINDTNAISNFTLVQAPTGWELTSTDCDVDLVYFGNGTANFSSGTDFDLYKVNGTLHIKNTASMGNTSNTTYISYTFCDNGYIDDSTTRDLTGLWTLFLIVALIIAAAYWLKDADWF